MNQEEKAMLCMQEIEEVLKKYKMSLYPSLTMKITPIPEGAGDALRDFIKPEVTK